MKLIYNFLILFITALLLSNSSCKKDKYLKDYDYIIFGSSYGMCAGPNCNTTYLLNDKGAFRSETYLRDNDITLHHVKLSESKFKQLKELSTKIPQQLYTSAKPEETFGCPDCADQGTLYLEIKEKNKSAKKFRIDTNEGSLPEHIKSIAVDIKASIEIAKIL
ncbi:MAG TPA: hypothetical protein VNI52_02140 [Sphingobacteriaceae bacterium]|nr:hypothetical protein [Sphingobacteriaceae bacterium]